MSFWPFSNTFNNNSQLQKFLDSIQDFSNVTVDDLLGDSDLSQELLSELHNIKGNYNNLTSFQFSQQPQQHESASNNQNADLASLASSNNENNNNYGKDTHGAKLLELLLQPHILNGFLDYIVNSVDFFHDLSIKEHNDLERLVQSEEIPEPQIEGNDEVEIEEAEESSQDNKNKDSEEETNEDKLRRCIQASSDVLSIDLWVISNRIIETPIVMSKLWSILSLPNLQESSPSVSYLVHILDQLMDTNSIELLNFIRRQKNLVDTFLNKIEIPMLMDFFLRVIQTDKADSPTGILETLSSQQLISKLIDILKPEPSQFKMNISNIPNHELFFKQTAATDFIKALVTISSNTALAVVLETNIGPNQLTRELVSPRIIYTMINDIILYKVPMPDSNEVQTNKHGINNCVGIIIEVIRKNNSDYDLNCGTYSSMLQNGENGTGEINSYVMFQWLKDFEQNPPGTRDPIYLGDMLAIFSEHLDQFAELMDVQSIPPMNIDSEILGFTKFKMSELIAELLHCSNMILLNSKKIRKIIHIRDYVRLQQSKRLRKALDESLVFLDDESIDNVITGLDDISLDELTFLDDNNPNSSVFGDGDRDPIKSMESIEMENDSNDDEPTISPENPFVCGERDANLRSNPCVGDYFKIKLIDSRILLNIISKFTKFPWHNFFHNVVFDLIQQIFNGKLNSYNSFLIVDLFKRDKCDLTNLIIRSYRHNLEPRPGYIGHLILISEEVVKFTSLYKPDLISPIIVEAIMSEDWEWFVDEILLKTREVYNVVLGAEHDEEEMAKVQEQDFGFDSSTVGYLDLESYDNGNSNSKNLIILGDKSNHDLFVSEQNINHDDETTEDSQLRAVKIQKISPKANIDLNAIEEDSKQETYQDTYHKNDFLDNLSGSSSSDEDNDRGDDDDDDGTGSNELRRVPKHNE